MSDSPPPGLVEALEQFVAVGSIGAVLFAICLVAMLGFRYVTTGAFTREGALKLDLERYKQEMEHYSSAVHRLVDAGGGEMVMGLRLGNTPELLAIELKMCGTTAAIAERGYSLHLLPARRGVMFRAIPIDPPRKPARFTLVIGDRQDRHATRDGGPAETHGARRSPDAEPVEVVEAEVSDDGEGWQVYAPGRPCSEDGNPIDDQPPRTRREPPWRWPRPTILNRKQDRT
ncbi:MULTISPECIES: hypothetical protein [Pimelobacter]|uniref:hypothetical protein n=1 Tax=Pimelobacter TaxID=2044 RepID=UPI001C057907|nr:MULTISPECIES: hypothetical protein [Pimelobacter]MBU2698863.1 hypothetical protein [Pimelobacter sp. 30-1]UUW92995.1 hypothetical protein M0M43_30645 [Pimelobacter simplex]UUW99028.1 hypothetical protein M0M48_30665 [Pimelobacter simplex]